MLHPPCGGTGRVAADDRGDPTDPPVEHAAPGRLLVRPSLLGTRLCDRDAGGPARFPGRADARADPRRCPSRQRRIALGAGEQRFCLPEPLAQRHAGISAPAIDHRFPGVAAAGPARSEEHTSELQSLMRKSYAVLLLKKKMTRRNENTRNRN